MKYSKENRIKYWSIAIKALKSYQNEVKSDYNRAMNFIGPGELSEEAIHRNLSQEEDVIGCLKYIGWLMEEEAKRQNK